MLTESMLDSKALETNKNIKARHYWKNRLVDYEFNTYFDYSINSSKSEINKNYAEYVIKAPEQTNNGLISIAESNKAKHVVLLSALGILTQKCSSSSDILIFSPVYTDSHQLDINNNIVPVRMDNFSGTGFPKFLTLLKSNIIQDIAHSNYPLKNILNKDDEELKEVFTIGMLVEEIQKPLALEQLLPDILFSFSVSDQLFLNIKYNTNKFDAQNITQIANFYFSLLYELTNYRDKNIEDIELISEEERHQILYDFNNTKVDYPKDKTIIDLFEEQVKLTPNSIAVICKDSKITYEELDSKSNQLGHLLREKGVVRDGLVAIMAERSIEMIIGIYGIIKAGGAYLPIDPNYPLERKKYIIDNSKASILLVQEKFIGTISGKIEEINIEDEKIFKGNSLKLSKINSPSDLIYTIYTSGSTGDPKGVMIEQHSVVNRITWMQKQYPISEGDIILQKTPIVFDVSVWELFWWSMQGASLYMLEPGGEKDPKVICKAIKDNAITIMHFVPPMLQSFLEYLENNTEALEDVSSLNYVFASGEALLPIQANTFHRLLSKNNKAKLVNLYGPTEATVDVSYFNCFEKAEYTTIPIGKPIDNTSLYILNKNKGIQPIGVVGELYIGGICLARGYINNKALTEEKFINSPINEGERIYKTGDLARWLPDGNIEFFGRIDNQVKIRGFRIELGEIENILLENDKVIEAVVIVSETKQNEKRLIAYVVLLDKSLGTFKLKKYLRNRLPGYMVPSNIQILDKIPLTPNGKVDRKALSNQFLSEYSPATKNYIAPKTETEKKIAKIWKELLEMDKIGLNDRFIDLGGHSILIIKANQQMKTYFNVELSYNIYFSQTLEQIANEVK